ncbi:MAG: DUF2330 domain-containing protein [Proteobacteria bacterium]|nr:DUF2330 domain-containing protein [Pseudomonadota bacterium]
MMQAWRVRAWNWRAGSSALLVAGTLTALAQPVAACGGLFCSQAQPVNQAAERIMFVDNGDGTLTAVVQILYEGPSELFAWVLPVPGVPEVNVSSDQAFMRLQQASNPLYRLQRNVLPCGGPSSAAPGVPAAVGGSAGFAAPPPAGPPVVVRDQGTVGPYDYSVISLVDPNAPADVAVKWLTDNGYDVTAIGPRVLAPYLMKGMNLLAFRLTKGNNEGSIRPIIITYNAERASIPIVPTAVAANDNMGIMVWVVGANRAIPANYKALELNEARLNWFNPNSNYNEVVSDAADEANGQGFVTELAAPTSGLDEVVFSPSDEATWQSIMSQHYPGPVAMLVMLQQVYGAWDGYEDALRKGITLPPGLPFADFQQCPRCYIGQPGVSVIEADVLRALYEDVVKPMIETQRLLSSRPYVTRLYTTMSASEMTLDPEFDFNPDLPDYSNTHVAEQVIECGGTWEITLPQGDKVRGMGRTWPDPTATQPAARRIFEVGTTGAGNTVMDNTAAIAAALAAHNATVTSPMLPTGAAGVAGGAGAGTVGGAPGAGIGGTAGAGTDAGAGIVTPGVLDPSASSEEGCSCALPGGSRAGGNAWLATLGVLGLVVGLRLRRRR